MTHSLEKPKLPTQALISEVGPRDGLQNIASVMPTEAKKAWISAEAAAGVAEIEVGSFVPKKVLPQLADTEELVQFARGIDGLTVAVLAPNLRGVENALKAGADKITLPFSVSETHSLRNIRRTHEQIFDDIRAIVNLLKSMPPDARPHFEVGLSTAFGCTIEGPIEERKIVTIAERAIACGADEVGLADTSGYASPTLVKRLIRAIWNTIGKEHMQGIHLHNTRGQGLANVMAALELGVTTIDSSLGGLGGCPFAPGASGNIVTEDLVFLLESSGVRTGIDIDKLLETRRMVEAALPNEQLYGFLINAGLPLGFKPAKASRAEASSAPAP